MRSEVKPPHREAISRPWRSHAASNPRNGRTPAAPGTDDSVLTIPVSLDHTASPQAHSPLTQAAESEGERPPSRRCAPHHRPPKQRADPHQKMRPSKEDLVERFDHFDSRNPQTCDLNPTQRTKLFISRTRSIPATSGRRSASRDSVLLRLRLRNTINSPLARHRSQNAFRAPPRRPYQPETTDVYYQSWLGHSTGKSVPCRPEWPERTARVRMDRLACAKSRPRVRGERLVFGGPLDRIVSWDIKPDSWNC